MTKKVYDWKTEQWNHLDIQLLRGPNPRLLEIRCVHTLNPGHWDINRCELHNFQVTLLRMRTLPSPFLRT